MTTTILHTRTSSEPITLPQQPGALGRVFWASQAPKFGRGEVMIVHTTPNLFRLDPAAMELRRQPHVSGGFYWDMLSHANENEGFWSRCGAYLETK